MSGTSSSLPGTAVFIAEPRAVNLEPSLVKGLYYNPATDSWSTGDISAVNYYIQASKPDISTKK